MKHNSLRQILTTIFAVFALAGISEAKTHKSGSKKSTRHTNHSINHSRAVVNNSSASIAGKPFDSTKTILKAVAVNPVTPRSVSTTRRQPAPIIVRARYGPPRMLRGARTTAYTHGRHGEDPDSRKDRSCDGPKLRGATVNTAGAAAVSAKAGIPSGSILIDQVTGEAFVKYDRGGAVDSRRAARQNWIVSTFKRLVRGHWRIHRVKQNLHKTPAQINAIVVDECVDGRLKDKASSYNQHPYRDFIVLPWAGPLPFVKLSPGEKEAVILSAPVHARIAGATVSRGRSSMMVKR